MNRSIAAAMVLLALANVAVADDKEDAGRMVGEAVAAVNKDKAAALAEIGKPDGRFVMGEVYVFAYDLEGTMLAHPVNPKLVGKNLLGVPDAEGRLFRKAIIEGVKASGVVRVAYKYKNPKSGVIEDKISLCKKAADVAVCAGYYK